jgi:hypothetical protein
VEAILVSVVIACFAPAAGTRALGGLYPLASAGAAAQAQTTLQDRENSGDTRYHGTQGAQYQPQAERRHARSAAPSAHATTEALIAVQRPWNRLREYDRHYSKREYAERITTSLISPQLANSNLPVSSRAEDRVHLALRISQISARKQHSISPLVSHENRRRSAAAIATESDTRVRLHLQIGLLLGLAYLGFLALWFWATRFGTRLRRGARV